MANINKKIDKNKKDGSEKTSNKKLKGFLKGNKFLVVGGVVFAVGVIGMIPSVIFSVPYVSEKITTAAEYRKEVVLKEQEIKLDKSFAKLNLNFLGQQNSRVIVKPSDKDYSYIKIVDSLGQEIKNKVVYDNTSATVSLETSSEELETLKFKNGMTVDSFIQTLANKSMLRYESQYYNIEVCLKEAIDLEIADNCSSVVIDDSSIIKSLKSPTDDIRVEDGLIETLNLEVAERDFVNLNTDILSKFNNIKVGFKNVENSMLNLTVDGKLENIPKNIDITADEVILNSNDRTIANNINLNARRVAIGTKNEYNELHQSTQINIDSLSKCYVGLENESVVVSGVSKLLIKDVNFGVLDSVSSEFLYNIINDDTVIREYTMEGKNYNLLIGNKSNEVKSIINVSNSVKELVIN